MLTEPDDCEASAPAEGTEVEVGVGPDLRPNVGPRGGRRGWLILAAYLAAAFVVTWHLWADPASRTVAGNVDDADLFAWYMRYAAHALAHWQLPSLVTSALNAPGGINLMWNSSLLLPSILCAPVTLLFGAQASLTALTTLGFAGSAAALFWVLRRWQVSESAAALAGALYGFSPALLQSALGHYDLQLAVLPPLIVDAMLRIAVGPPPARAGLSAGGESQPGPGLWLRPEVRTGIWLGLLVTAEIFVSEELALTTVLTGTLLIAIVGTGFGRQAIGRLRPTLTGAAVAVAVTLATAGWALWVQFFGPLTQSGSPFLANFYVNDLTGFVTPSSFLLFHTSASAAAAAAYRGQPPEYLAYLGWPLIIVLVVAACAFWLYPVIRSVAATAIVLALLSLGGYPLVSGVSHTGVFLPWRWLQYLPLAGSVLPDRFSILLDGFAAVLLALALDQARQRLREFAAGARSRPRLLSAAATGLAVLACLPIVPLPLPPATAMSLPAGWTTAFTALHLPDGARVLVVPVPSVHLTEAMRWQADSGQQYSLIGGYFIGPAWDGHAYVDGNGLPPTAVYLNQLWAAGLQPGTPLAAAAAEAGIQPATEPPSTAQVRADLTTWKPQVVVAVTSANSPLATYLTQLLGAPSLTTGTIIAWRRR